MATTVINVKYVNPAKPGKKNASIKTDDDQFFLVPPDLLGQFQQGGRYKIEYKASAIGNMTYKFVEKVEPDTPTQAASPIAKHQAGKYGVSDDVIAERIFVSGILQRSLANTASPFGVEEDMLVEQVNKLRSVWRRTFGNPQRDGDMQDEIPY